MSEDPKPTEGEGQGTPTEQPPAAGNTLTQEEANKLIGSARVEARTALLKKFGVSSEEELKTALQRAKELEDAQLSELERAQKENEELKAAVEATRAEAEAMRLSNLRARLGRERGLPEPLIEKLVATDEDEINAEIEALLPFIKAGGSDQGENLGGGTNPAAAGDMGKSPDEKMADFMLRSLTHKGG